MRSGYDSLIECWAPFYFDPQILINGTFIGDFEFSFEIVVDLHNLCITWCYDQTVIYVDAHNHIPSVVNTWVIF